VVIPTKNAGPGFRQTLEMIFAQQVPYPFEVIVVDSGSQDATLDICHEFSVRLLRILPKSFNHGATRNYAISQAQGEFIILTVQDAVPADEGWMDALVRNLIDDPEVAGAYGRQLPRPDSSYLAKQRNRLWYKRLGDKRIVHQITDVAELNTLTIEEKCLVVRFDNVNGCMSRSVWEQYQFPPYMYAEDIGWALEVLQAGYKIVYDPTARVLHSHDRGLDYELRRAYIDAKVVAEILGATPRPLDADQACQLFAFLSRECTHCLTNMDILARSAEGMITWPLEFNIAQIRESFGSLMQECDQRWRDMEACEGGNAQAPVADEEIAHFLDAERWHRSLFDVACVRYIFGPDSPWSEEERQWLLKELDWLEERAERERLGEEGWHRSLFDVACVRYIFGPDSPWPEEERRWLLKELDWLEELDWIRDQARWGNEEAIEWLRERGELKETEEQRELKGLGPKPWLVHRLSERILDDLEGRGALNHEDVEFIVESLWAKLGQDYIKGAVSDLAIPRKRKLSERILNNLRGMEDLSDEDVDFIFEKLWVKLGRDYVKGAVSDSAAPRRRKLSERILNNLGGVEALNDEDLEFIFKSLWTKLGPNYVKGAMSDLIASGKPLDGLAEAKKASNDSVRDLIEEAQREGRLTKSLFWRIRLYAAATAIGKQLGLVAYSNLRRRRERGLLALASNLSQEMGAWAKKRANQADLWDNLSVIITNYLSKAKEQSQWQAIKQALLNVISSFLLKVSGKSRKQMAEESFWKKLDRLLGKGI